MRKRCGRDVEEMRRYFNLFFSSSFPYLFPSSPSFIIGKKRIFEQA
jgi:hypothetical protein